MTIDEDRNWSEQDWKKLVEKLIEKEQLVKWHEVASLLLGALNPPQVGTSMTGKIWQERYGKGTTWQKVREWFYDQRGRCEMCGSAANLEKAHKIPVVEIGKKEANRLENIRLLCKRCNAIERPSHKHAGETFLTTEAALMWLLFRFRPKSYGDYEKLCRNYGLTMANIRFKEAWAMAEWLKKEGKYP